METLLPGITAERMPTDRLTMGVLRSSGRPGRRAVLAELTGHLAGA